MISKKTLKKIINKDIKSIDEFSNDKLWYTLKGDSLSSYISTPKLAKKLKALIANSGELYLLTATYKEQNNKKLTYSCSVCNYADIIETETASSEDAAVIKLVEKLGF